ncbi:MAG: hypothetical protein DMF93_13290, partial [Acidobacteria bacterium]
MPYDLARVAGVPRRARHRAGWKIEAPLGDEILLRRGDAVFRPSSEIAAVIRGETTEDQWRSRCAALEI